MVHLFLALVVIMSASAEVYTIKESPIQMALHENGMKMPKVVRKFTKKVTEVVLDNLGSDVGQITMEGQEFISGSSSINAVIRKVVPLDVDEDGTKRLGTFVPRGNGAGNPIAEIAAFNLALIFGQPKLVRPAVRAEMDVKASYQFKKNWEAFLGRRSSLRRNELKMDNAERIFSTISSSSGHLYGALKAKKEDCKPLTSMCCRSKYACQQHPIQVLLKAGARQPETGKSLLLNPGVTGDELALCREFSVVMTIDAILGQWDRYTGTCGNLMYRVDKERIAHIYSTDNGGANLAGRPSKPSSWTKNQLKYLERFDRKTIEKLREMSSFLSGGSSSFLGYSDKLQFVEDIGLYGTQYAPYASARAAGKLESYRVSLLFGIDSVLKHFENLVAEHGEQRVYLPEAGSNPFIPEFVASCLTDTGILKQAQKLLNIGVDGQWGNGSRAAFNAHEARMGRTATHCLTSKAQLERLASERA